MDIDSQMAPSTRHWRGVLGVGLMLWLLAIASVWVSHDLLLVPAALLFGGLLAPATLAAWAFEREPSESLSTERLLVAATAGASVSFLVTGVVGSALASRAMLPAPLRAGILEELAKVLVVAVVATGMGRHRARDGIFLGAAVGLGFATLENAGYALRAFAMATNDTGGMLNNQLVRNLQTPLTHVLWSALAGGFLLIAAASARPRWQRWSMAAGGLALAATLHAYWDAANAISLQLAISVRGMHFFGMTGAASATGREFAWDAAWLLMIGASSAVGLALLGALWRADEPAALQLWSRPWRAAVLRRRDGRPQPQAFSGHPDPRWSDGHSAEISLRVF